MRLLQSLTTVLLAAGTALAASGWGFDDATVVVKSKQGNDVSEKLSQKAALTNALVLDTTDTIKIALTAKEDGKAKRPHQAFVIIREEDTGLEAPFALTMRDSGKGFVEIPHKELPVQHLLTTKPLHASIVIASFGSSRGLVAPLFDIDLRLDPSAAQPKYEKPLRYGKLPEIHHIFRSDAKTPPKIISLVFAAAVVATIPVLFISWFLLGANLGHLGKALSAAPLSYAAFMGSIVAMEGVFLMYYREWTLFQVLPAAGLVGAVIYLSGTKALGEVQSRRLAGER